MNIESQVTNLELSKRLNELDIDKDGYFCWFKLKEHDKYNLAEYWQVDDHERFDIILTFTVAELLIALPHRITLPDGEPYNSFRLRMEKGIWLKDFYEPGSGYMRDFYSVNYYCDTTSQQMDWIFPTLTKNMTDESPANALAKMRIYLLENKLI